MIDPEPDRELSARLRSQRPEMSAESFAAGSRGLRPTAPSTARRSSSVLAAGLLGLGVVFCGSGSALAVSGFAGDGSAVSQQYAPAPPQGGVLGTTAEDTAPPLGAPSTAPSDETNADGEDASPQQDVAGTSASGGGSSGSSAPSVAPQSSVSRQVAAVQTSGSLPYTGFAAIPVLLLGAALLAGGVVLRRRTQPTA